MATTSEIEKLLNQNIEFAESGYTRGKGITPSDFQKFLDNGRELHRYCDYLRGKAENGTITDEESRLLEKLAENHSAWTPEYITMFNSEPMDNSTPSPGRRGKREDPIDRYAREQFHETRDRYGDAMRLARKGLGKKGDGLSTEEHKEYQDAVAYLKKRMKHLRTKKAFRRTSSEEDALLDLMTANQKLWANHNGKPLKVDGEMVGKEKGDEVRASTPKPRHYEPSPLDIPFVSESIDEMAQAFGYGTYGDENDRLSHIIAAWAKRRASEATDKAKDKAVGYVKNRWANRGKRGGQDTQEALDEDNAGLTAFLYQYAAMRQRADDGDTEAMAWIDGEGSDLLDYWFDRVCEPDDEEWYEEPHHVDDLKASFEEVDDDGVDIQGWMDQQAYDPFEAYLAEHPLISFARDLRLRARPVLDRIRNASSGLWNTIRNIVVKPAIEMSKMSDEEWRRKTDPIKERQRIWVDSYTKSDGTRVKGHNKTITRNAK